MVIRRLWPLSFEKLIAVQYHIFAMREEEGTIRESES
jgi:hypothetical protein